MPPPAIVAKFSSAFPIATATWHVNFLNDAPTSAPGGWWLVRSRAEHAQDGYSSQDMTVFGRDGQACVTGRQCVAIFDQVSKL